MRQARPAIVRQLDLFARVLVFLVTPAPEHFRQIGEATDFWADSHRMFLGRLQQALGFCQCSGQRFFAKYMEPAFKSREGNLCVVNRRGRNVDEVEPIGLLF